MEKTITLDYGLHCIVTDNWKRYDIPMTMYNLETLAIQEERFGMYVLDPLTLDPIDNEFDLDAIQAVLATNKK